MKKAQNMNAAPVMSLDKFFGMATIEKVAELHEQLERPLISAVDTGIIFNHLANWVKELKETPVGDRRKVYTFTQFIWLKLVQQLRTAGLSLPIIAEFKSRLFAPLDFPGLLTKPQQIKEYIKDLKLPKDQKDELLRLVTSPESKNDSEPPIHLLHLIIIESILKKLPIGVAVFMDGSFIILDKSKETFYTEVDKSKLTFDTHIVVSISQILKTFFLSELSGFVVPELGLLTTAENQLFQILHTGDYESITIHFKDKKMKLIELKKTEDTKQRIVDILNKDEYGEIIVKKHKGAITKITNTVTVVL